MIIGDEMKQTFVVDIGYDDQYRTICDLVNEPLEPHSYLTKEVVLLKDQRANVGDTVYFRCLHYWYKGIIAMGGVDELVDDNCIDVKFVVAINPKEKPIMSIAVLEKVLPNKNWKDRYDCIVLDFDEAQILDDTWELFMKTI